MLCLGLVASIEPLGVPQLMLCLSHAPVSALARTRLR